MPDEKIYGLIVEWKNEGPLIMEGPPSSLEDLYKRMEYFVKDNSVIRVAIFRAVYQTGNETLLPKEQENGN